MVISRSQMESFCHYSAVDVQEVALHHVAGVSVAQDHTATATRGTYEEVFIYVNGLFISNIDLRTIDDGDE